MLLSFTEDGKPCPAPELEDDYNPRDWDRLRVVYSIERYKLDYGPLNDARRTVWQTARALINEWVRYNREYNQSGSVSKRDLAEEKLEQLAVLLSKESPFSMVAIASLDATGNQSIQKFTMTTAGLNS